MRLSNFKTLGLATMSLGFGILATTGVAASIRQGQLGQVLGDSTLLAQALPSTGTSFLPSGSADGASILSPLFQVNIPAVFTDAATLASLIVEEQSVFNGQTRFVDEVILENGAQLLGNLDANGIDIDVGTGEITASNLVYSVIAGGGITVSGDQDITITNADRGSAQKIFGKVKVGSDTAEAGSNTDTFEFSAGDGISLSLNTSDKKMTLTASNLSGWYKASSSNVALITSTNNVGIGTTSPSNKLEVDSGTDGETGITFTRVTSSTAAGVGGGKVLSVDSGGKMILVEDQTGGGGGATPSAEAVLPSATTGMTIYYNGTNWVSSNNLYHDGGSVGISTTNPLSRFQVNSNLASKIAAIFRGYTSQTANLTEWQDVNGNVLSYIDANGVFNGSANVSGSLNPGLTTGSVLFQGASGITQDNSGFFWDDTNNRLGIGTSGPLQSLEVKNGNIQVNASSGVGANFYLYKNGANVARFGMDSPNSIAQINTYGTSDLYIAPAASRVVAFTNSAGSEIIRMETGFPRVGIGTSAPLAFLHVQGGYGANDALTVNQTLSGNILSASASGATKMVLTNAGNVGIGTTVPGTILHLYSSGAPQLSIQSSDNGSPSLKLATDGWNWTLQNSRTNQRFDIIGASATRLSIDDNTGNVGIATTNPSLAKLHVYYGATHANMGSAGIMVSGSSDQTSRIASVRTGMATYLQTQTTYGLLEAYDYANGQGAKLSLNPNGGFVGINTTNPGAKLHIYGTSSSNLRLEDVTYGSDYAFYTGVNNADSFGLFDVDAGAYRWFLDATGLTGIGTTSPTAFLHVNGGYGANDALTVNQTLGGNILSASASGTTRFVISNSGNVGIGTNSPGGVLEVRASNDTEATTGILLRNSNLTNVSPALEFGNSNVSIYRGASHNLVFNHYGNALFTSVNNGRVGIGTLTPTSKFQLSGSYGGNALMAINESGSNTIFTASASGTTRMVLTNAGRMGLGFDTPGFMLDIIATADNTDNGAALALKGTSYTTHGGYLILNKNTGNNTAAIIQSGDNSQYTPLHLNPSGGNVGVGTTSTSYKLDVNGTARVANLLRVTGDSGGMQMDPRDGSGTSFQWYNNTGDDLRLYGSSDLFTFTGTGRLGIGETSPQAQLHVGPNNDGHVRHSAGTIDVRWDFVSRVYLSQNLGVDTGLGYNSGGIRISGQAVGEYGYILGGRTAAGGTGYDILFNPNNSGNIGIGTYVPGARLQVSGNGTTTGGALNVTNSSGTSGLYVQDQGNIGMGTTAPIHRLQLTGTQTGKALAVLNETGTNDILTASSSGTTRFVLRESGRIGINTSNPEGFTHIRRTATNRAYTLDGNDTLVLEHFDTNRLKWVSNNTAHQILSFSDEDSEDAGVIGYYHDTDSMGFATNFTTALRIDSAQNVGLTSSLSFGTSASRVFVIAGSTAPTTSITDGIQMFAVDQSGSHELRVRDEAGNVTTLSPHNFSQIEDGPSEDLAWAFYSERGGLAINADMTKALRLVEKLSGEKLVYVKNLTNGQDLTDFYADQAAEHLTDTAEWVTRAELNPVLRWTHEAITLVGTAVFEKPAEFLADVTIRGRLYLSDKDAAGYAVIKAGATTVTVPFEHEFITPPVVTVTAQKMVNGLRVEQTTKSGFTITISEPLTEDVTINWVAVAVVDPRTIESVAGSSIDTASPAPTPLATSTPTPQPTPTALPSPTPEVSAEPVSTPNPTPSASPSHSPEP